MQKLPQLLVALLLGIVLGLGLSFLLLGQKQGTQTPVASVSELESSITIDLLKNPIVYEWRGSVTGVLIDKTEHTFTLEDAEGNRITITNKLPSGEIYKTIFVRTLPSGETEDISFNDIPIGTTLRGEFWIFRGAKDVPIGGTFVVVQ